MISGDVRKISISYLKESKKYVYFATILFFFFGALGFIFASHLSFLDEVLKKIILEAGNLKGTDLALYIFANNTRSALIGIFFGAFLGIIPFMNIVGNGLVLGYVLSIATELGGIIQVWKIFPHGIFELPAIFIALGLGIKLGMSWFSPNPLITFKERLYKSVIVFVTIIFPLLAIAAVIEGWLISIGD